MRPQRIQAWFTARVGTGGISGGTVESGIQQCRETAEVQAQAAHPYAIDPARWGKPAKELPDKGGTVMPVKLPLAQVSTGPFFMAGVNEPVVRKSAALLGYGVLH